jgi:hypothetical protein
MRISVIVLLALLSIPSPARAGDEEASGSGWHPGMNPDVVAAAAAHRWQQSRILLGIGISATAIASALMIGEVAVKPEKGYVGLWAKDGCFTSFILGSLFLPLGVHLTVAGLFTMLRSRHLGRMARVMEMEGPDGPWLGWHRTGKFNRIFGQVLTVIGTVMVTAGLVAILPHVTCEKWECQAWPEYGRWHGVEGTTQYALGLSFSITGASIAVIGAILMATGYSQQNRVLVDRHEGKARILLSVSPTGLLLRW